MMKEKNDYRRLKGTDGTILDDDTIPINLSRESYDNLNSMLDNVVLSNSNTATINTTTTNTNTKTTSSSLLSKFMRKMQFPFFRSSSSSRLSSSPSSTSSSTSSSSSSTTSPSSPTTTPSTAGTTNLIAVLFLYLVLFQATCFSFSEDFTFLPLVSADRHPIRHFRHHLAQRRHLPSSFSSSLSLEWPIVSNFSASNLHLIEKRIQHKRSSSSAFDEDDALNTDQRNQFTRQRRQFHFPSTNISLGYQSGQTESGPWQPWSELSECTRECGGGVNYQTRACYDTNRSPGSYSCVGPSKRYFSCNIQDCAPGTQDFREDQCSRFDALPFEGRYYNWIPYTKAPNPCELNCLPKGERFYYRHARKVIDGTRCYTDGSLDICVDGVCVELGCDRVLGSGLKEDRCRVCGGDDSTCRTVEGVYEQNTGLLPGYNDILLIPAGATNIRIAELKPTNNYLAIRNLAGAYLLNGDWRIQHPRSFDFSGTTFYYDRTRLTKGGPRQNQLETLKALGPINEPLFVSLLYQEPNQGISYHYSVPFSVYQPPSTVGINAAGAGTGSQLKYAWIFGDYSQCSQSCGTGVQRRDVFCASIDTKTGKQEPISESLCDSTSRPADSRPCHNSEPCPARWQHGKWSQCSCVFRTQQRTVYCSSSPVPTGNGSSSIPEPVEPNKSGQCLTILPETECEAASLSEKPIPVRSCVPNPEDECPVWLTEDWSECDTNCGVGIQSRTVRCGRKSKKEVKISEPESKTEIQKSQENETEPATDNQTESPKNDENLVGTTTMLPPEDLIHTEKSLIQKREVEDSDDVVEDYWCDLDHKPETTRSCFKQPCSEDGGVEWLVSSWSSCDVDCGTGTQTRNVVCSTRNGTIYWDEICLEKRGNKPADTQECTDRPACSRSLWFSSEWSSCNVQCDTGIQTRTVFCGHVAEDTGAVVKDEDETKCDQLSRPSNVTVCVQPSCQQILFSGPLGPCSLPCGGGQRLRSTFCYQRNNDTASGALQLIEPSACESGNQIGVSKSEQCNLEACDDDQIATTFACQSAPYGCCPIDNSTPADQDFLNCPPLITNETVNCLEAKFGCCPSVPINPNVTLDSDAAVTEAIPVVETILAQGPFALGCPINCQNTRFGCCPDGFTTANSSDKMECPPIPCEVDCEPTTTTMLPTTTEIVTTEPSFTTIEDGLISQRNCSGDDVEGSGDSCIEINTVDSIIEGDCAKSIYGCCPDTWAEAKGPNGEGCEDYTTDTTSSFISSTISSLVDLFSTITSGGGTNDDDNLVTSDDDDCTRSEFGCCPNGKKKAIGPRFYGCTCDDYQHGCCQDRFTPASGPSFEGCICSRMLHGCCADGVTPATGPDMEGCNCESSTYGCCPDMVTAARGPNYYACPCETLEFGCCPASTIPARGPNFDGCTCAETPFGCCADGVTVAYGPKFEGCPSGPSLDVKLASEVCSLPLEIGPCRNFSVKWFFDVAYGGCNRFWYGGCEGNGNRFSSQELCQRACVKPEGPERCTLPKISGPCNSSSVAFYYNPKSRQCEQFLYGGCLGNTNRFERIDQCEQACVNQEVALDMCDQPVSPGPCRGNYRRYYYRREESRCREFFYGGCQGNLNNFQTEEECQNSCASQTPFDQCALPKAEGPCLGNFPRWHFDSASGVCREFVYSGCEGNKNRFVDRESCERLCNQTVGYYGRPTDLNQQGYPDNRGGVGVSPAPTSPKADSDLAPGYESVCALPKAEGPCRASIIQWYFNSVARRCERFYFGGCEGNANRFDDRESCEHRCLYDRSQQPAHQQDPCLEAKESGQCSDYRERWFYNLEDRRCHRFYYSGCGGNRNNFFSLEECTSQCERPRESSSTTEPTALVVGKFQIEYCSKQYDAGLCTKNQILWYYDRKDGVCKEFVYGGCGGNENRFESQYECQTKCWNSQDICRLAPARGSCTVNFTQWYYDYDTNDCYEFQFSGCHGNANRFSSKESCSSHCGTASVTNRQHPQQQQLPGGMVVVSPPGYPVYPLPHPGHDPSQHPLISSQQPQPQSQPQPQPQPSIPIIPYYNVPDHCRLVRDPGICRGYFNRWYYAADENQCRTFIYGGCGGNENRFPNKEDCESSCLPRTDNEVDDGPREGDPKEVICRLRVETGPCHETQVRWFYDSQSHNCLPFAYGGCQGNKNRFNNYEHCIQFCGGVLSRELVYPVQQPQQPNIYSQAYPDYSSTSTSVPPPPSPPPPPAVPSPPAPQYPASPFERYPPYQPGSAGSAEPSESHCEPMDCNEEHCLLGIDYYRDSRGCAACRCTNPCYDYQCPEDQSCALELYRDENGKPKAHAECRLRNKPGSCPRDFGARSQGYVSPGGVPAQSSNCVDQCRSDADCRTTDKCCNNGCADICIAPEGSAEVIYPSPPRIPPQPPQRYPYPSQPSGEEVTRPQSVDGGRGSVIRPEDQHVYHTDQQGEPLPWDEDMAHVNGGEEDEDIGHFERYDPYPAGGDGQEKTNASLGKQPQTENQVTVLAGKDAVLDCIIVESGEQADDDVSGFTTTISPIDSITTTLTPEMELVEEGGLEVGASVPAAPMWSKEGQHISSLADFDRYEILSNGSLHIRSVHLNDHGTYACVRPSTATKAQRTGISYNTGYVRVVVNAPVRILPGPKKVIAQIGHSSYLQCNAIGYPDPKVTWWRGDRMLPLNSLKYRQFQNYTLLVRKVGDKDSGIYSCHAYNGIGSIALWNVTLLLDAKSQEPDIVPYNPTIMASSHGQIAGGAGAPGGQGYNYAVDQRPAYLERIGAQIRLTPMDYRVGSTLQLDCVIQSLITGQMIAPEEVSVVWYVNSDIPLSLDSSNQRRYRILSNHTLLVYHLTKADSGEYRCRASSAPTADAVANVNIQVENIYVPSYCQDSPYFANCETIVRNRYCQNPHYAKFCCRSCYIAGQIQS